jgi:hypothetical protein
VNAERLERYSQLARDFATRARVTEVDAVTAAVANVFAAGGIDTIVLKGPVLAKWLYPDEVRPYVDSDLMVAPKQRARAVGVLERLGFAEHCEWMPTLLSLDPGGTAFNRSGGGMVDLHCQLPGLDGDPDSIWGRAAQRFADQHSASPIVSTALSTAQSAIRGCR